MSSRLLFPDLALLLTLGCAAQRPVLCPNAHLKSVGTAVAEQEVNDCIRLAETSGAAIEKEPGVAKETAEGAVVGSAAGAGWGLVAVTSPSALQQGRSRVRPPRLRGARSAPVSPSGCTEISSSSFRGSEASR